MRFVGSTRRKGGFTLIETMIVVLVISTLLAIAVPNWMKARETARLRSCVSNMRHIASAKEQFATEYRRGDGDGVAMADIVLTFIRQTPTCPGGGDYTPEPIGTDPSCPNAGMGHVLE